VYFTSPNRLIAGAKAEEGAEDLYRYNFAQPLGERLTDLTSGGSKGLVPGDVQGVIGTGDDGTQVYFVARAALTPASETNQAGEHSEAGKDNLYIYDSSENKTSFIAQTANSSDWETGPKFHTARVSADGQHLAFVAEEVLTGFDNTLAATTGTFAGGEHCFIDEVGILRGGKACPEVFLYDKPSRDLVCVSCNAAGTRPLGPASLPGWRSMSEGPRYLSDDGKRVFFETYDRLAKDDVNNKRDVYEFELAGDGTCSTASPAYDPVSGGCHFLVSNGHSNDESLLLDASSTGRDVFFSTRSALTGADVNENYDIYDYREDGGFPEPAKPAPPCTGETDCKTPASNPPVSPSIATPSFGGPGNITPPTSAQPSTRSRPLTTAQKLAKALKKCRTQHNKHKRIACEHQARRGYSTPQSHSKKAKSRKGGK
jgi:hypothetical protein